MLRLLSFCFILFTFQVFVLSHVPQSVLNGRTSNQQEEILIVPKQVPTGDAFIVHRSNSLYKDSKIQDVDFAELSAHLLGLPSMNVKSDRSSFPDSDHFTKSKGQVVIAIDSLGQDSLDAELEGKFKEQGQKISIIDSSYPQDSISRLTTLLTGTLPSEHGIPSSNWFVEGRENEAYSSNSQPERTNLPDVISQNFQGRSFALSLSTNFQLASALCPHSLTLARQPFWNNFCYFWNQGKNFVDALSVQMDNDFLFTKDHLLQSLRDSPFLPEGYEISFPSSSVVTISAQGKEVSFDVDEKADLQFLLELEFFSVLKSHLETKEHNRLRLDKSPDFYGIGLSSLGFFHRSKEEPTSDKFLLAFDLLSSLIPSFVAELNASYSGRLVSDVVFLGSEVASRTVREQLTHTLKSSQLDQVVDLDHLPFIPRNTAANDHQFLHSVSQVKTKLKGTPFQALHLPQSPRFSLSKRSILDSSNTTSNSTITNSDLANFHICLWVPITLVIVLIAFVSAMYDMNTGKDTLLFRS